MYFFPNLEPFCSMSGSYCCILTCIQVSQVAGNVAWYSQLFKNFPQFVRIHTVKSFWVVNKAEVDVFLELSSFFYDPMDIGNLISGSSALSKSSLYIWKFSVQTLLKPSLKDFEHYFPSMWNACNCVVVWTHLGIAFLPLPTTEEMTLHVDITRWSILKSDGLCPLSWRWRNSIQSVKTRRGMDWHRVSSMRHKYWHIIN